MPSGCVATCFFFGGIASFGSEMETCAPPAYEHGVVSTNTHWHQVWGAQD